VSSASHYAILLLGRSKLHLTYVDRVTPSVFDYGNKAMILSWLDTSKAVETGIALADQLAPRAIPSALKSGSTTHPTLVEALREILARTDHPARAADLNFYKRAKLANSFKWRLIESGVERAAADEITQALVLNLSVNPDKRAEADHPDTEHSNRPATTRNAKQLLAQGNQCMARGAYPEAIEVFNDLLERDPHHAIALNNIGTALSKLGRYQDAENCYRSAIRVRPDFVDAYNNLGMVLRWQGHFVDSERSLRQALKLNPSQMDARINLGITLMMLSRFREATGHFKKVLKVRPRNAEALFGMGQIAGMEGRFDESEKTLKRALEVNPKMPVAWAALSSLRKMTPSDDAWLRSAEGIVTSEIPPIEAATLHFAIGKYHDDVGHFAQAFKSYKDANELLKSISESYDPEARTAFVDDMIRLHSRENIAAMPGGTSASMKPVFVVGMARSGTSLTEQIIASHPQAKGAGELEYWSTVMRDHEAAILQGRFSSDEPAKKVVAENYLRTLEDVSGTALRVVDKAPINSDYLGVIHSIFPKARIIYMQRDPIDTCLSCYFQNFSLAQNFTLDLSDIAHYYQEHHRLANHWRSVLPQGSILDVPYEELVENQEAWTRKILAFVELEWDARCLDFQTTERPIVTASFWQARQKIFKTSVQRWRNYEEFIAPLRVLEKLRFRTVD
jgi:tetratricopeptide (TPR) repeat protein